MIVHTVAHDVVVVDDLLGADDVTLIREQVNRAGFMSVHERGWDRAWRLHDGSPWRGGGVYFDPRGLRPTATRYPTASAVDAFIDALRSLTVTHPGVVGCELVDWDSIYMCPWLYPADSALTLHRDGRDYSGAFTYFVHPRWRIEWGGELVVVDQVTTADWCEGDTDQPGFGRCIFPRPNRLVLIGPDRAHLIRRVDRTAGDHVRTSLAGFFLRPAS